MSLCLLPLEARYWEEFACPLLKAAVLVAMCYGLLIKNSTLSIYMLYLSSIAIYSLLSFGVHFKFEPQC